MDVVETLPTVIGTAAIAPALLMLWLVIAAQERPGPPTQIWGAFLLSALSVLLLGVIRIPFSLILDAPVPPPVVPALHAVFGAAFPEELLKVVVILLVCTRRQAFEDPMDRVVLGAAVGLGFAAYENLAYLVQYAEIWRSVAAVRGVLTVPFHGALGVIAGAYLTIATSGTALGAHRFGRRRARFWHGALMLLVPVALHAAFDYPLLSLRQFPDIDDAHRIWLGAASLAIGAGAMLFAAYLVLRVARHHAPRTEIGRERLGRLRRMWALLVAGGGAGLAGLAFLLTALRQWFAHPDYDVALLLMPIGLASVLLGILLLGFTLGVYFFGRSRIRAHAPRSARALRHRP
ncbi:MAG: PrsW family intramembrane metalloprotease [Alphaproteobacteria bacterium]|nr:PrsW family intramembrane metalloprotease [Alphaproteobacteria bacterium]